MEVIIGIIGLAAINIVAVAYSYGKLSQKVNDMGKRLERVEQILNNKGAR